MNPSPATIAKAGRGVADGAVHVDINDPDSGVFIGLVQGSAPHPYAVAHGPNVGWSCTCPARSACWHILACMYLHANGEDPT